MNIFKQLIPESVIGLCQQTFDANYTIKPIRHPFKQFLGYDHAKTRPFYIVDKSKKYKLIAINPHVISNHEFNDFFTEYISLYSEMSRATTIPSIIASNNEGIILEWWDGETLLESPVKNQADVELLVACIIDTYRNMTLVENELCKDRIVQDFEYLVEKQLISNDAYEKLVTVLSRIAIPKRILKGACFGDVSMPNFLRYKSKVGYIDTMGIARNDIMLINISKIENKLPESLTDYFYQLIENEINDVSIYRDWANIVTLIRQVNAKSKHGKRLIAMRRRLKSKKYAVQLQNKIFNIYDKK